MFAQNQTISETAATIHWCSCSAESGLLWLVWQPAAVGAINHGSVTFEAVDFAYPSRPDLPILRGFNLSIEENTQVRSSVASIFLDLRLFGL